MAVALRPPGTLQAGMVVVKLADAENAEVAKAQLARTCIS